MDILGSIWDGLINLRMLEWKIAAALILIVIAAYVLEWLYKTIFRKKEQGS